MGRWVRAWLAGGLVLLLGVSTVYAGPVILGGDDETDHGSRDGSGNNLLGWLYIEKALANLNSSATRPGAITVDVAGLGSASNMSCPPTCSGGNAGDALQSAASNAGLSYQLFDGDVAIQQFFTDLASGAINPRIIWLAGTDASNNLDSAEGAVLTANASALAAFVASGGGLMAHGCDGDTACAVAYGWLSALLPGLSAGGNCNISGALLTAAGQAAFPGLSNADITSGPCHNVFTGDLGSLQVLAFDGNNAAFIIGGGPGTQFGPSASAPALGLGGGALTLGGLLLLGVRRLRRQRGA